MCRLQLSESKTVAQVHNGGAVGEKKINPELDNYDLAILSALADNVRLSTVELAEIVHLSRTAVSRRISSLKRTGFLNGSAEVIDYKSIGFDVRAFVDVSAPSQLAESLGEKLLSCPEVLSVSVLAGNGLLSLDVIAVDMDHLHGFVRSLQKSGETSTHIVFAEKKSQLTLVERMRILNAGTVKNTDRI